LLLLLLLRFLLLALLHPTQVAATATVTVCAVQAVVETEDMGDLPELMPGGDETNSDIVTTHTSLDLMKFLCDHWDTHALSPTFFSFSLVDSFVYYMLKNKIVAKLRIPAGFSIVVTTEIHSGLLSLNPYTVKHCSESADDRLTTLLYSQ
jgi:hypothetical protein